MAMSQSSILTHYPSPHSDLICSFMSTEEPHRKTRLTAPAHLHLREAGAQAHRKTSTIDESRRNEIKIVDEVDEMLPQFDTIGEDTSLCSPQSGSFTSASLPFVLDGAMLSFHTPTDSPESSGPEYTADLPTSAVSTSFVSHFHDTRQKVSVLRGLSVWRGDNDGPTHIYAQMLDLRPEGENIFLDKPETSSMRYEPMRVAMNNLSSQLTHLNIPLVAASPTDDDEESSNHSMIAISLTRRNPVRLLTAVYSQGVLASSYEVQMEEHAYLYSEGTLYSAPLPQELIDGVCTELDRGVMDVASDGFPSGAHYLDSVAVMRFVQQKDSAMGEETVLAVVAEFHAVNDSSSAAVEISHLALEGHSSQKSNISEASLPTPPLSNEHLTNLDTSSRPRHRPRSLGRPIPKLSVSIPPLSMQSVRGIQLCTDSPESTTRPTPLTGIPSNVLPVTPLEQLIHTPLSPPQISQSSVYSRSSYASTPSESAYPFMLSSTSPGSQISPTSGVFDWSSCGGSAPAWIGLSRNMTPFTPSFFIQQPYTSDAMSSLTQRALDAGTPTSLNRDEYFGEPLASPIPITFSRRSQDI